MSHFFSKWPAIRGGMLRELFGNASEQGASRKNILFSNNTSGLVNTLIGGNFFTGFLLLLNADDNFMGFVALTGFVGSILQIFSPILLERFEKRKNFLIAIRAVIYFFNIIVIGLIPKLPAAYGVKLSLILIVILLISLLNSLSAPGLSIWHIKNIPENLRAGYFSFYNIINGVILYSAIMVTSRLVDRFKASGKEMDGLLILRGIALIFCLLDIYFLFKIKEHPNHRSARRLDLKGILLDPFKNKRYLVTVLSACLWNYSANIPGPYFGIYMLKDLHVSYTYLNYINMLNIPALIFLVPFWRKRIGSTSWLKTFYTTIGLFVLNYIGLAFVTKETLILYPVSIIFSFLVAPGIYLVMANMPYLNIPEEDQTNYIGFFSTMNGIAALLGVLTGKFFVTHTEGITITLFGVSMQNKQYMLLATAVIMFCSVLTAGLIQKRLGREFIK